MRPLLLTLSLICPPAQADQAVDLQKISDVIFWVVTPPARFEERRARPYFGTRAYKEPEYRSELSRAFVKASKHFNLPLGLLLAIGYRESVYKTFLTGPGGELGIMQVGKYGRRKCKEYCSKVAMVEGGIMCGACWLDKIRRWCKNDIIQGLRGYVGGKCISSAPRTVKAVNKRLKLWITLAKMLAEKRPTSAL